MPGFVTCGPNEVLVISGCCHSKPYLMPGGRVFVWPWFQILQKISLNTMTLTIESPDVYTKEGVPISLTGIAQVKVNSNNAEMISLACEHFLCKTETEIISIVQETMEGHQREVMASMTVETIYRERKQFSKQVYQAASSGLSGMGLTVVSYTVKDIKDHHGYLRSLGEACTASVKKDAEICEAEALKKTQLNQTEAEELKQSSALKNELEIARSHYQFREKKCQYDQEVCEGRATADFAAELQRMETRNKIWMEKLNVELEERELQVKLAEEETRRTRLELDSDIRKLADAERERMKLLAEAHREKVLTEAEAEASALLLCNAAKAFEIEHCGKIECDMMAMKATAMQDFNNVARMDMILEILPRVAAEIAAPLAKCPKITMVSQGEGELGANKMTNEILEILHKVHNTVDQISSQSDDEDQQPHRGTGGGSGGSFAALGSRLSTTITTTGTTAATSVATTVPTTISSSSTTSSGSFIPGTYQEARRSFFSKG